MLGYVMAARGEWFLITSETSSVLSRESTFAVQSGPWSQAPTEGSQAVQAKASNLPALPDGFVLESPGLAAWIVGARTAGYSDQEIVDHLSQLPITEFKFKEAIREGDTPKEILDHLAQPSSPKPEPTSTSAEQAQPVCSDDNRAEGRPWCYYGGQGGNQTASELGPVLFVVAVALGIFVPIVLAIKSGPFGRRREGGAEREHESQERQWREQDGREQESREPDRREQQGRQEKTRQPRGHEPKARAKHSNWWEVLEVSRTANLDEIRRAYRNKVRLYHPDRLHGLAPELIRIAEEKTKELNSAVEQAEQAYAEAN
jgi:hypothetical protein